jgi:hypothetical protein
MTSTRCSLGGGSPRELDRWEGVDALLEAGRKPNKEKLAR